MLTEDEKTAVNTAGTPDVSGSAGTGTAPKKKSRWTKEAKAARKKTAAKEAEPAAEAAATAKKKTRTRKTASAETKSAAASPKATRKVSPGAKKSGGKKSAPAESAPTTKADAPVTAPAPAATTAAPHTSVPASAPRPAEPPKEYASAPRPQTARPPATAEPQPFAPAPTPTVTAPASHEPNADRNSRPQEQTAAQPQAPANGNFNNNAQPYPGVPSESRSKKRRRRRKKNRLAENSLFSNENPQGNAPRQNAPQNAQPLNNTPQNASGANSAAPQPTRYGDAVNANAHPQTGNSPAPGNTPAPTANPPAAQSVTNGESVPGSSRKKRRRHKKKHGNSQMNTPAGMFPTGDGAASAEDNTRRAADNFDTVSLYVDTRNLPGKIVLVDPAMPSVTAPQPLAVPAVREKAAITVHQTTGRKLLINVIDEGQARVAVVGKDGLEELHIEKGSGRFVHGNIFKGKVDGVQPNLQAAFINIGGEKNAFLHVGDVVPPFGGYEDILGRRRKKAPTDTKDMRIDDMLVEGQEVLVQITREALVTKGPSVTTYLSIPGRYLVAMPNSTTRGVSKKITDDAERRELKKALEKLSPPKDMGYIIRTAGMGKGTEELQLDLDALNRMWQSIGEQAKKSKAPAILYQENDLVIRTIRDNFRDDIDELYIDSAGDYARAMDFVNLMMPDFAGRVKLYDKKTPMFHAFGIEDKISNLFNRSVKLKSGGEILLEQTEAMVTIDVNTGKMGQVESTKEMILQANLEAAEAIAREIRLRDLGGLIMIDFIDMDTAEDRKTVEQTLRRATRNDPSRITILPISQLGVLEMTRQRLRQSLHHTHYRVCPYCGGAGMYKRPESLGIEFLRRLRTELEKKNVKVVKATLNPHTAFNMANEFRRQLADIENEYGKRVILAADDTYTLDRYTFSDATNEK